MDEQNTEAAVGGVLTEAVTSFLTSEKECLVEGIKAAFAATGPKALETALIAVAERVQAMEKALGA